VADPRDRDYARLLVDKCIGVQPGWQVVVYGDVLGRPLIEEVLRAIAERGAYGVLRLSFGVSNFANAAWIRHAPKELLDSVAPLERSALEQADAVIVVQAPENTRDAGGVEAWRLQALRTSLRPAMERLFTDELPLSVAGRPMEVDAGGANVPGGEVFCSPVEDSAEGEITFAEFPAVHSGRDVAGVRLRFEGGKVVDATAQSNEAFLVEVLDSDEGARRLGELGIGCNPGITRHTRNTLFDEKIDGTVHLALGNGIPEIGGTNVSSIHWDIVKDLRPGGRIELDGEVVQQDGAWVI
jgi:leucyl aminopeptidase (aminopeptidase T)